FRSNPTWAIRLNSEGFRTGELGAVELPSRKRIACLGDSWTFGMNVNQDQSYTSRLAAWLKREDAASDYEVLNFGVLGYTSFQGLQLLKTRVLATRPDMIVIGFAMNDSQVAGYRDKDMVSAEPPTRLARLRDAMPGLEIYKLLKYEALALAFKPTPL